MKASTRTPRGRAIDTLEQLRPRLWRLGASDVRAFYPIGHAPRMTAEYPGGVQVVVAWHDGASRPWAVTRTAGRHASSERDFEDVDEAVGWLAQVEGVGS